MSLNCGLAFALQALRAAFRQCDKPSSACKLCYLAGFTRFSRLRAHQSSPLERLACRRDPPGRASPHLDLAAQQAERTAKARGAAATTGTSQPPRRIWSLLQLRPRASASREPGQQTQPTTKQAVSSHGAPRVALLGRVRGGAPPGHEPRGVDGAKFSDGDEPPGAGDPKTNKSSTERIGRNHVGPRGEAGNWD